MLLSSGHWMSDWFLASACAALFKKVKTAVVLDGNVSAALVVMITTLNYFCRALSSGQVCSSTLSPYCGAC
jgi:hypothetical protein